MTISPASNVAHAVLTSARHAFPDRTALVHGTDRVTFAEFDDAVNRTANALADGGVGPGDRVATLLASPRSVAEIYLAQARLGSVLCALNPFWTPEVLAAVVEQIEADVVLYDAAHEELIAGLRASAPGIGTFIRVGDVAEPLVPAVALADLQAQASGERRAPGAGGDDLFAFFFTSGTTGTPKAVQYTHASAIAVARDLWVDVPRSADSVFGTGTIIWGVGFIAVAAPALIAGMPLVLEEGFGPARFLDVVPRESISHISVTPSFFTELLSNDAHVGVDLDSLQVALLGGEPLLPALRDRIAERLPNMAIVTYYGQTEAPYSVIGVRGDATLPDDSVGRPRFGGAVRVVDGNGSRVYDEVGEIQIAGPQVSSGYFNRAEATAEAYRGEWFVGGDVGSIDRAGNLRVLGRRADAIERDGVMTLPVQIEDLACRVPGVVEAGAAGVIGADGETTILLAVAATGDRAEVSNAVSEALSSMPAASRPDRIVVVDELPHADDGSGGRGKLLRRRLVELFDQAVSR